LLAHHTYSTIFVRDNEKLIQIKEDNVGGACGTRGKGEKRVQGLGGKALKERPLGRLECRRKDGLRMDLGEIGWEGEGKGLNWLRVGADSGLL
jgi:hypothetical protein